MFPEFQIVRRQRPVTIAVDSTSSSRPAANAAIEAACDGPVSLSLSSGGDVLTGRYDGRRVWLETTVGSRRTSHASRRHGVVERGSRRRVRRFALTLTGTMLTALTCADGDWVARARVDLSEVGVEPRAESWLAGLSMSHDGAASDVRTGAFGQLGLRDIRVVTYADGSPFHDADGTVLLTATSAGPGFFPTAHTSVWALDPVTYDLVHRGALYFRRDGLVYGDHATHLMRDGDEWVVTTSTWAGFKAPDETDPSKPWTPVGVAIARSRADLTRGEHVLDATPLELPTDGPGVEQCPSVGVWDPHLVRHDGEWLVGYVSAKKYFDFHPMLAGGPSLDALTLRAARTDRTATEGTTLVPLGGTVVVGASDGRDNPRHVRARYPVFDLDLEEVAELRSEYVSNLPWPTLIPVGNEWLHVAFDGTPHGGRLPGYGTHGEVVLSRSVKA
ncbi:hypothetical protein J2S40_003433 [Nocardioides luteus]|uniref:Uncharacterized protein n=1 Tax=Nocardioides luteus TaxID=1844 RepID=A0ABQ5SWR9_9ACTN|nr:hypothetical protein [Nocardioides luteus]MDR7312375.1 hypothetical protein [Nocardioides luteus]GGR58064.1 hypothetical protein GCM10010197_26000 [Nocardioides luteus]GLJ68622.1 hypothetical protein GCM10017579_26580 [Nocardioides luteus]